MRPAYTVDDYYHPSTFLSGLRRCKRCGFDFENSACRRHIDTCEGTNYDEIPLEVAADIQSNGRMGNPLLQDVRDDITYAKRMNLGIVRALRQRNNRIIELPQIEVVPKWCSVVIALLVALCLFFFLQIPCLLETSKSAAAKDLACLTRVSRKLVPVSNAFGGAAYALLSFHQDDVFSLEDITEKVKFLFYRNALYPPIPITPDSEEIVDIYNTEAPLYVLIHGFKSDHKFGDPYRAAFQTRGKDLNLIIVDWSEASKFPFYGLAAANTKNVGILCGLLFNSLISKGLVTAEGIHVIGHSLGAHVANWAGKKLIGGKLGRITALDPAGLLFRSGEIFCTTYDRIDSSDAIFVDVIHTAGGESLYGGLGLENSVGHLDFYPNNGRKQPGCGLDLLGICSHKRAHLLFCESILNENSFEACSCIGYNFPSYIYCECQQRDHMGLSANKSSRGNRYLITNAESPFSRDLSLNFNV